MVSAGFCCQRRQNMESLACIAESLAGELQAPAGNGADCGLRAAWSECVLHKGNVPSSPTPSSSYFYKTLCLNNNLSRPGLFQFQSTSLETVFGRVCPLLFNHRAGHCPHSRLSTEQVSLTPEECKQGGCVVVTAAMQACFLTSWLQ